MAYIPETPATTQPPEAPPTTVVTVPTTTPTAHGSALPITGGDILSLSLLGAAAFAAGTVLVRRTRRSRP